MVAMCTTAERTSIGCESALWLTKSTELDHQKYNQLGLNLDGSYLMDNNIGLSANFGYQGKGVFFYGYDQEKYTFGEDSVKQKFNSFDLAAELFSVKRTSNDFSFDGGLDFGISNDRFDG